MSERHEIEMDARFVRFLRTYIEAGPSFYVQLTDLGSAWWEERNKPNRPPEPEDGA